MMIEKLEIEAFGGLKDYTLTLGPGFHYLYGENEAGKSTLCAFLSAMLYGFPKGKTAGRDERRLYMPWGESKMGGSLYFTAEGKQYIIKRKFGKTAKGDSCALISAEDWQEIPASPEEIGERFLGVGAEAFRKTLYISQLGAAFEKGREDEIMSRLSNLENAGDEDVSLQKALAELEKAQLELVSKTGRGGAIAQLDAELDALTEALSAAEQKQLAFRELLEQIKALTAQLEAGRQEQQRLTEQREAAKRYEQFMARQKERTARSEAEKQLAAEKAALIKTKEALAAAEEETKALAPAAKLGAAALVDLGQKEAAEKAAALEIEACEALRKEIREQEAALQQAAEESRPRVNVFMLVMGLLLAGTGVALGLLVSMLFLVLIPTAAFLVSVAFFGTGNRKKARQEQEQKRAELAEKQAALARMEAESLEARRKALRAEMEAILAAAGAESVAELSQKIEAVGGLAAKTEALEKEQQRLTDSIGQLAGKLETLPELAEEEPVLYDGPTAEALTGLLEEGQKKQMEEERLLAQKQALYESGFAGTKSMAVLQAALFDARERRSELAFSYEAVSLARELLEACSEELKSGFTPVLNEKTGALIEKLTGGRYTEAKVTDAYKMMLKTADGYEIVDSEFVSAGTCDLIYFALRLAVLKTLFPMVPLLILDDAFVQLDDARQKAAFSVLSEEADTQILYFSCHKPPEGCSSGTLTNLKTYAERKGLE